MENNVKIQELQHGDFFIFTKDVKQKEPAPLYRMLWVKESFERVSADDYPLIAIQTVKSGTLGTRVPLGKISNEDVIRINA